MKRKHLMILLYFIIMCGISGCQRFSGELPAIDLVKYVNPLQGTMSVSELSHGNTYPAICMPFGMNCWTPQTGRMNNGWQYTYASDSIRGFKQTHQPSPWMNDYGCFSIMPGTDKPAFSREQRGSKFSHMQETALPHYYKVMLEDYNILTELTPTERSAYFRFTFPKSDSSFIVMDAFNGGSYLKVLPEEKKIVGYTAYNHGGVPGNFANYFVIEVEKDFKLISLRDNDSLLNGEHEAYGDHMVAVIGFKTIRDEVVHLKASSSFISLVQAEINLNREIGNRSFEEIKTSGFEIWNKELNKIKVEGGSEEQKATFYSCLYHLLLFPRMFYEYNVEDKPVYYSPYDGKLHEGYMMTDNGFWDTFRAVHPFFTLLYPEITKKQLKTIVNAVDEGGWMPQWASPGYRNCMIGNHSCSLIADAWMKGIRDVDIEKAYAAMVKECFEQAPMDALGRDGYKEYNEMGYVPYPDYKEASAKTLEYAYDDFCIMQVAKSLGRQDDTEKFRSRALNYVNVFDSTTGFMRGRTLDGRWFEPFDPVEWGGPFTEGNAWHYTWSVFHDIQGLIDRMGGKANFCRKLDAVFKAPNTIKTGTYGAQIHEMTEMIQANMGQYAHGNQPIQHMIYLYNYAGEPWKTQYWVRYTMDNLYSAQPDGYCGDEDNGQTSAWYVFSALGFYPVTPGYPAYVLGSPLFEKVTLQLPGGNNFVITAAGNSQSKCYIQGVKLNGITWPNTWIPHDKIIAGGTLEWEMGENPNRKWGSDAAAVPYSLSLTDKN